MELNRASMVQRHPALSALSMHPVMQLVVLLRLSESERVMNFDAAVKICFLSSPNPWEESMSYESFSKTSWEKFSDVLPHVSRLMEISDEHEITSANPAMWTELVLRAGTEVISKPALW